MQLDYSLKIKEVETYESRIKKDYLNMSVWIVLLILMIGLTTGWGYGIAIGLILFLLQLSKIYSGNKYYISEIYFNEAKLEVVYFEGNVLKNITGDPSDFKFKIRTTWNTQFTVYYLAVIFKDELLLRQFESREWKYKVFKEVVDNLNTK